MANANIEVIVNVDKTMADTLAEMARTVYRQTGLRLQRVDFDWIEQQAVGYPPEPYLNNVTVTSSGSGKP